MATYVLGWIIFHGNAVVIGVIMRGDEEMSHETWQWTEYQQKNEKCQKPLASGMKTTVVQKKHTTILSDWETVEQLSHMGT